jgi:hypothetical protein
MSNLSNSIAKENVLAVINSDNRLNPDISTSSSFTYSFNDKIDRIIGIAIKNVQIPFTFYVFEDDTEKILTFNDNAHAITIPNAVYTTSSLAIVLKNLIDAAFGDTTTVITFDTSNQILYIRRETSFKIDTEYEGYPMSTAAVLLGFTYVGNSYKTTHASNVKYQISGFSTNNTNTLTFNFKGFSDYKIIKITPGNYTISSLAAELKLQIDTAFGDTTTTVKFSNIDYKLTITRATAFYISSYLRFPESTASRLLGFTQDNDDFNYGTSITGTSIYNISGPNYILIRSRFLVQASNRKTVYINDDYKDVLAVIPIVVSHGDIISVPDNITIPLYLSYKWTIKESDIIDITITDENGTILDLNGAPVSIQLIFMTD